MAVSNVLSDRFGEKWSWGGGLVAVGTLLILRSELELSISNQMSHL